MSQLAFAIDTPQENTIPVQVRVRKRLAAVLQELRDARELPWTAAERQRWELLVPQMCKWLDPDEAHAIEIEFLGEITRLTA